MGGSSVMDSVLLDTNVLLDFFVAGRAEHRIVDALLRRLVERDVRLCVVASSLERVYYVIAMSDGRQIGRQVVDAVLTSMDVLPVDAECCRLALACSELLFDDALVRVAAEVAGVSFIVTRDKRSFIGSTVPSISPGHLLHEIESTYE